MKINLFDTQAWGALSILNVESVARLQESFV